MTTAAAASHRTLPALLLALSGGALRSAAAAAAAPTVILTSSALAESRLFDGFSGLSGGGATSRLLPDYPEPQRGEILDLLFKPFFGASIHSLKVEVGGATFSGCGTEPTHMFNASDLSYERGYEWWLMRGASSRNPSVLGYALPWGFPHWIGEGNGGNPLTRAQADYMASFCLGGPPNGWRCDHVGIACTEGNKKTPAAHRPPPTAHRPPPTARQKLTQARFSAFIQQWNERDWSIDYVLELRAALDAAGLTAAKIVVPDGGLDDVVAALQANATFRAAVYSIGVHYPSGSNSTAAAVALGVPLWASEDSSTYFDAAGGACLARILNWNYIYGNYTFLSIWNLISSYYDRLAWSGDSLMGASSPWSGHYDVMSPLWAAAHLTQFAWPGWRYLPQQRTNGGSGGAGELPGGGTFVTLVDATGVSERVEAAVATAAARNATLVGDRAALAALRRDLHVGVFAGAEAFRGGAAEAAMEGAPLHWSLVLETTTTAHSMCIRSNPSRPWAVADAQDVTFVLDAGLVLPASLVVFKSVFFTSAGEPDVRWFERQPDLAVDAPTRSFTVRGLHPDTVLSLSSMDRGQQKGSFAAPPPNAPFPSPYADTFEGLVAEHMPAFFSDHAGSWSAMPRRDAGGAGRTAFEQRVVAQPVGWDDNSDDSLYRGYPRKYPAHRPEPPANSP